MNSRKSYPLNGADRFQLYFDLQARKVTGTGNVIRVIITVDGVLAETEIKKLLEENEGMRLLSTLSIRRNIFSGLYRFETKDNASVRVTIHRGSFEDSLQKAISKDCNLFSGEGIHADVIYTDHKTHLVISVSHVLMDHTGMENLISSFAGENNLMAIAFPVQKKSFASRFADAVSATMYVSSINSRALKRLAKKSIRGRASFELIEFTEEETGRIKNHLTAKMNSNALSFFLGSSLYTISKFQHLLTGKKYFVPVPVDRRPASCRNSLLSNFLSFIYFTASDSELENLKKSVELISRQTITQARKNIPAKFISLLDLFRFVPKPMYKAFIELPGNGHAATFAFSLLSNSGLEGKKILGYPVSNVTHYAPVISPPGLNVIFSEFNGRLKILCSFDDSRIKKNEVVSYLETLKLNLLS